MLNEWSVIKEFLTKHFNMSYYKIKFEKAVPCSKFVNNTLNFSKLRELLFKLINLPVVYQN